MVFFISLGLLGILFDLSSGLWIGLSVGFFICLFISLWGEKIILIFAKARYVTDDELLINQVKNFCTHIGIAEVKVYWTSVYVNNLYYVNSQFGKPTLIIGKNLYQSLTRNELNSLIYASLLKIKSKEAQQRSFASLLFFILYSPIYILQNILANKASVKILDVFLYPAYSLKSKIYEKPNDVFDFDKIVGKHDGLRNDYVSALFKIAQLPSIQELSIGSLLLNDLVHVKNQTEDVFSKLLINSVSVTARVKALK